MKSLIAILNGMTFIITKFSTCMIAPAGDVEWESHFCEYYIKVS